MLLEWTEIYLNTGSSKFPVEKQVKHRYARIAAMIGFITIPLGGMAYSLTAIDSSAGTVLIVFGLAVFVAGVEIAMKTKEPEN